MFGKYFVFSILINILAVSSGDNQDFYDKLLKLHNEHRAKHDANELSFDVDIAYIAKLLTNRWNVNKTDMLGDDLNYFYGYNVFTKEVTDGDTLPDAEEVFFHWYNKGVGYDYSEHATSGDTNPFTQIVWKQTKRLGLDMIKKDGYVIVLAIYDPPGNKQGHYAANVTDPESTSG